MFGVLSSDAEVKNLHLENLIGNGSFCVGGIAGANNGGTITGCMVTGTVSGANYVGGVVGSNYSGTVEDCYWKADADSDLKGIGTGSGNTTQVTGSWEEHKNELKEYFTIVGDTPVPKVIAEQNKEDIPLINNPLTRFVLGL